MYEHRLFISLEQKHQLEFRDIISALGNMLSGRAIHIIWITKRKKLTSRMINIALKNEKQLQKKNVLFKHTIEMYGCQKITSVASFLLRQYNFELVVHVPNCSEQLSLKIPLNIHCQKSIRSCLFVDSYREEDYFKWIKGGYNVQIQQFVDITKIYLNQHPISCKFNSCLSKTLFIDETCTIGICPYVCNDIHLKDIKECSAFEQIFETDSYLELLYAQIKKREKCLENCSRYYYCKGGCPFSSHCEMNDVVEIIKKSDLLGLYDLKFNSADNLYREYMSALAAKIGDR